MREVRKFINKRLSRNKIQLEETVKKHGDDPGTTHTYWGGEEYGRLKGRVSAFEDILDVMEENPITKYYVETPLINFTFMLAASFTMEPKYNVRCLFEVNGKKHKFEEEIDYYDIRSGSEDEQKRKIIKIVFERVSKQLFYYILKDYKFEELKI